MHKRQRWKKPLPKNSQYFFSTSLFLVGAVALVLPSGYSLGFALLCFTGMAMWVRVREDLLTHEARYFLWPLLVYAIGHTGLALQEKWALREFGTYLPFVTVLFGYWIMRKCKPNADWFWVGLAIGAIGAAVFGGYQAVVLTKRAGGFTHPIQFGDIALLLGVLCLVRGVVMFSWGWRSVLMWVGFVGGMAASVWSQTRGGWLALLLIFVWIFANATKGWTVVRRVMAAMVLVACVAIPAMQTGGVVQSRVREAMTEVHAYFNMGQQDTSVGSRLAMWKLGLQGIAQSPFLGLGNQGWLDMRDAAMEDGRLSRFSAGFTHLHNEYLNVTFKRGLVGLALYLAMYLLPMLLFFKPYLHDRRPEVRALAMAGMVVPMMFMDFGLTQTFLSHNSGRVVLCSLWMCIAGLMLNAAEDN